MHPGKKTKRFEHMVGCKVTPAMFGAVQEAAQSSGRTVAELVRVLIERYLSMEHGRIRCASNEILLEEMAGLRNIILSIAAVETPLTSEEIAALGRKVDSNKTLLAEKILARLG